MQFKSNMTKKIIMVVMAFTLLTANMTLPIYAESSGTVIINSDDLSPRRDG